MAPLIAILKRTVLAGDQALIGETPGEAHYLALLGQNTPCTAGELWQHLVTATLKHEPGASEWLSPLDVIFTHGCLARRIITALERRAIGALSSQEPALQRDRLAAVYRRLCRSLAENQMFIPASAPHTD
jgi:hypothetical protein